LQETANGIREDFKSAIDKYNKYQQEKVLSTKPNIPISQTFMPNTSHVQNTNVSRTPIEKLPLAKIENGNIEKQMRYPAEDIRFKNKPLTQNVVSIPVMQQAPLVSNTYQDDDDDEVQSEQNDDLPVIQCKSIFGLFSPAMIQLP
jgi:hypothetical protein